MTSKLETLAIIDSDADTMTLDAQVRLAVGDALTLEAGDPDAEFKCLFAHLQLLHELTSVDNLFKELVARVSMWDGLSDDDLDVATLLAGVERMMDTLAYWSMINHSYTPEVAAHNDIAMALEAYRKAKQ